VAAQADQAEWKKRSSTKGRNARSLNAVDAPKRATANLTIEREEDDVAFGLMEDPTSYTGRAAVYTINATDFEGEHQFLSTGDRVQARAVLEVLEDVVLLNLPLRQLEERLEDAMKRSERDK
jgi:hypothetical protein